MRFRYLSLIAAAAANLFLTGESLTQEVQASRIVAVGGSVTEIVYALGEEERLIGRDSTSIYPPEALQLKDTGYIRALSPEGILSLNPDLILALDGAGPPDALATLQSAGVRVVMIPEGYDEAAISRKVNAIGEALGVKDKANTLAMKIDAALHGAINKEKNPDTKTRVLFVLSLQSDRIMAAGSDSHADGIVKLAGGENVMAEISGYKQVSDEAIITAAPDVILMMTGTGDHSVSNDAVLAHPAIAATPAGKSKRVIRMDGMYLLGFGPRTADAVTDLHDALYSDAQAAE